MTWAVSCGECEELVWPPLDACGSGGKSEIAALRLALEHARESGHTNVDVVPGAHYVGDGKRPEDFGDGVTVEDCTTPTRGKVVDDLEFAIETLRSQAESFEEFAEDADPDLWLGIVGDRLRERADLSTSRESRPSGREGMRHGTDNPLLGGRAGIQLPLRVK